jgi:hypothetical protein
MNTKAEKTKLTETMARIKESKKAKRPTNYTTS